MKERGCTLNITEDSKREYCKSIWLRNESKLRKLCTYKLNSYPDEIEDILAEAALILWTAIFNEKTIDYPDSWLYSVTNNLIKKKYSEINVEKECKTVFDEENADIYRLRIGYDFESSLLSDNLIENFIVELDFELDSTEKQLYEYIYEDKLKMKEIAVLLSTTESAVKQKNYRMTRKIKKLIKNYLENF